jgi:acetylornithine aminotransferase
LEVLEAERLQEKALELGERLMAELRTIPGVVAVRGKGLMIGLDLNQDAGPIRSLLVSKYKMFTGSAAGKETIRLLPPLSIEWNQLRSFVTALKEVLAS